MKVMWYQWMALAGAAISFSVLFFYFIRLVRLGKPKEYSQKKGNVGKAIVYSNTVAMLPNNKESAYRHLPTFTLGILFHVGTFVSLLLFVLSFFPCIINWLTGYPVLRYIIALAPIVGFASGLSLFLKRIFNKKLKHLTNLDDYLSNGLTTLFQLVTVICLLSPGTAVLPYYIVATLLLLYMPVGKLRHVVYYFAARYHLGFFYGWRKVWPPEK